MWLARPKSIPLIQHRQMTNGAFLHQFHGGSDRFSCWNCRSLTHHIACCLSTATKDFIKRQITIKVCETQPLQRLQRLKDSELCGNPALQDYGNLSGYRIVRTRLAGEYMRFFRRIIGMIPITAARNNHRMQTACPCWHCHLHLGSLTKPVSRLCYSPL